MSEKRRPFSELLDAFHRWWGASESTKQPASRDVADEIHRDLPDSLSAREAIEADRRRKKKLIDDALAGND